MGEYQCCWNPCFLETWRWHKHQKHGKILSSTAFIRGLSAFDRGERLHSSSGSWFEGLDWLLPSARATWWSKNARIYVWYQILGRLIFFHRHREHVQCVSHWYRISGGVGMFKSHMCFETFLLRFFRSNSWRFFWGNIPGAMIPRRTLQTLLLVEKPMSCWAWILKKQAVGWHFTLTIALVGWDTSMPSSKILSNSKSFIGLYSSALWKQQVRLFPKKEVSKACSKKKSQTHQWSKMVGIPFLLAEILIDTWRPRTAVVESMRQHLRWLWGIILKRIKHPAI